MSRIHWLFFALAAGCSCAPPHEVVIAPPPSDWDAGMTDGAAAWESIDEVPTRCFEEAETLVVGPWLGCAELEVSGAGPERCGEGSLAIRGTRVRVVRRGTPLVRLKVLPRCAAGHPECEDGALGTGDGLVYSTVAWSADGPTGECGYCDRAGGLSGPGTAVVSAGASNPTLGFATNAVDNTVEWIVAGEQLDFTIEACAIEVTPLHEAHLEACRAACDRCGDGWSACRLTCEDRTALEAAPCLEARIDTYACLADAECVVRPDLRLDDDYDGPCQTELTRVEYECRAS